jgi:Holliday junction DNA helicase RuvB
MALNASRKRTGVAPVLFIDEVHGLGDARGRLSIDQEAIYPVLEDFVYFHNLRGKRIDAADSPTGAWTMTSSEFRLWPFTTVAATTEPGALSAPLLRRFLLHVPLEPYSEEDIAAIMMGASARLGLVITPEAAEALSKVARRNPGRSYQLLRSAADRATADGRPGITIQVAREIIARMRLYPLGLDETDIRILKLLASRPKGVGQAEISRALGISVRQFSEMAEPYLRQLGFVETLSRRCITAAGLQYLAGLARPE